MYLSEIRDVHNRRFEFIIYRGSSGASSKIEVVNDVEKRLSRSRLCEDVAEAVGASREPWSPTAGLPNVRTAVITRARSRISVDMLEPDFCFPAPEDFRTLHCDGRFVSSVPSVSNVNEDRKKIIKKIIKLDHYKKKSSSMNVYTFKSTNAYKHFCLVCCSTSSSYT